MGNHIFISYSSKNQAIAKAVRQTLEKHHLKCWCAPSDILPGSNYAEAIIEAIDESKLFILIFSKDSNQSQHVIRECERAVSRSVPIMPFRIDDVPPGPAFQYFIGPQQWLDASKGSYEAHLQSLAATVDNLLNKPDLAKLAKEDPREAIIKAQTLAREQQKRFVRTRRAAIALGVAMIVLVAGFGGWYFWSQANNPNTLVPYQNLGAGFKLLYPQGWSKAEPAPDPNEAANTAVAFYLPTGNDAESLSVIYVPNQQGTTLDDVTSDNLNQTAEYVDAGQMAVLESGATNFGGQLAYKLVYTTAAEQNMKVQQIWTVKNNTVYQISFRALPSHFSEYAGNAQRVIDSFQFT